jgi:hypothetical protein
LDETEFLGTAASNEPVVPAHDGGGGDDGDSNNMRVEH